MAKAQLPWSSTLRYDELLDNDWLSVADSSGSMAHRGFQLPEFSEAGWKQVSVPHNWDDYGGYIRLKHGNRHGDSWYRKMFRTPKGTGSRAGKQSSFLFFEGIGSYSTIWLNGHQIGQHRGGRTSFTLDITSWLNKEGAQNLLAVKADHPANIRDLPWVCGGCSDEIGFSEGSQPFGIFRPVHLIQTGSVRIEPFGVHIWNDTTVSEKAANLYLESSVKNYSKKVQKIIVEQVLVDHVGRMLARHTSQQKLSPGQLLQIKGQLTLSGHIHLWSLKSPYLYQLRTSVLLSGSNRPIDEVTTPYGVRWIKWPPRDVTGAKQFLLNGEPVFINGIAGYEHALGKSHAFSAEEIRTRAQMIKAMGFNAFRDAHQPHNLRFQTYWDSTGVLWWPQFSAHIWFDTPAFKKTFLSLLKDWVIERRNSPSNIMWGLQNESKLPKEFAEQCVRLIRRLDPTASGQRLITTCNGGEGTDWNVPQNWTGTYGGDPNTYDQDLKQQLLVGEYGGWRSLDLYTEDSLFTKTPASISSWCALMEKKIRLAAKVSDSVCGHFLWLLSSHDNPGRVQAADGYRDLDRIGPVNYKGLLTSWEEPTDGFYLYQSNFTVGTSAPMVYIVSHNWPDRWLSPGLKDGIEVYSNCDSVALYNDNGTKERPLGTRSRRGVGTHFTWNRADIQYNALYAVGYVGGKAVVSDRILLRHLPDAPPARLKLADITASMQLLAPKAGYTYIYRVNCGGPDYIDKLGQQWSADRAVASPGSAGSLSWTSDYAGLPAFFASQRRISDPIRGTEDPQLLQTFRYGRDKLSFQFPVPNGDYEIELYFVEPWWGKGSNMNCTGWRDFDVAVNGCVKLPHLDIFREAGSLRALKKTVAVDVTTGRITIHFPQTYSGQAVISAIAVAKKQIKGVDRQLRSSAISKKQVLYPYPASSLSWLPAEKLRSQWEVSDWLDQGDTLRLDIDDRAVTISNLPPALFGVNWLKAKSGAVRVDKTKALKLVAQSELTTYLALGNTEDKGNSPAASPEKRLAQAGFSNSHEQVITDVGSVKGTGATISEATKKNGFTLDVYQRNWHKGDTVTFYPWQQAGLIAFLPLSRMQPPYDQKPEERFAADKAMCSKNGHLVVHTGQSLLAFKDPKNNKQEKATTDWVSWAFITGVADFHSLQIKYANASKDPVSAELSLLSADGTVMERKSVILAPTRPGKWNNCSLDTKTMINAGHYQLKLSWKGIIGENLLFMSMKLR